MDQLLPTRLDVSSHDVPENCARDSERYDCAPDAEATVVFGPVVGAEELGAVDAADVGAHYYSVDLMRLVIRSGVCMCVYVCISRAGLKVGGGGDDDD